MEEFKPNINNYTVIFNPLIVQVSGQCITADYRRSSPSRNSSRSAVLSGDIKFPLSSQPLLVVEGLPIEQVIPNDVFGVGG